MDSWWQTQVTMRLLQIAQLFCEIFICQFSMVTILVTKDGWNCRTERLVVGGNTRLGSGGSFTSLYYNNVRKNWVEQTGWSLAGGCPGDCWRQSDWSFYTQACVVRRRMHRTASY